MNKGLIEYLKEFSVEKRIARFEDVLENRTRKFTVALENIYQPHNTSAVLRSCDCFGIQDVHIIENDHEYEVNPDIALGSAQWLTVNRYNKTGNNTVECINNLKSQGYKVYGTTPHTNDQLISEIPADQKTALVFGTEQHGLSDIAMENVDGYVKIPMYGFTESFNISVSVALCLHEYSERMRKVEGYSWKITEEEKDELMVKWLCNSIKSSELLVKEYKKSILK